MVSVAPCLSIVMGRSLSVVGWWSVALGVAVAQFHAQKWIAQGSMSLQELEAMKYEARGA